MFARVVVPLLSFCEHKCSLCFSRSRFLFFLFLSLVCRKKRKCEKVRRLRVTDQDWHPQIYQIISIDHIISSYSIRQILTGSITHATSGKQRPSSSKTHDSNETATEERERRTSLIHRVEWLMLLTHCLPIHLSSLIVSLSVIDK